ncbi:MAG: RidA family protein [Nitrospinota bacterium]|nr:RidA family protein [Nitrospinota bacterium]
MELKFISAKDAPKAIGPYSQAVKAGNTIYLAGQIPLDPATMELVPGGIKEQTKRVLDNLEAVLKEAGAGFGNVVRSTVYMKDLSMFADMNMVYESMFKDHKPARVTIQVAGLPKEALVEIEAVAVIG